MRQTPLTKQKADHPCRKVARSGKGSVILSMAAGFGTLGAAAAPVGGACPAAPGAATASTGAAGRTGARLCRRVMTDWAKALAPKAQEFLGNAQFLVLFQKMHPINQLRYTNRLCWPSLV